MSLEGHLEIRLAYVDGGVSRVDIDSSRPVHASRVFHGKSLAEAQKMLPLLFSICGTAQACAGARAGEQVLGLAVSQETEALRERLVAMEALREHLWRILLDWPSFVGQDADRTAMAEMAVMERDYRRLLCQEGNPFSLGGLVCGPHTEVIDDTLARLAQLLEKRVFGMPAEQWLTLQDLAVLDDWAATGLSLPAQLIAWIRDLGWSGAGACASQPLPSLTTQQLHAALEDEAFVARPQWAGQCCESTSLTREHTPLLSALQRTYGNGLLVRLVARLTEIARLYDRLRLLPAMEGRLDGTLIPINPGIGQALAARGQLVHRVRLEAEVIAGYQILAPTEWNFHPQGVVAGALAGLRGDLVAVETQARLLVNAIDPCVGYTLNILRG